jgi:hypothetical protein
MLPAVQSAEVAEEDQDDRLPRPVIPQPVILAVGAGEHEIAEGLEVHDAPIRRLARDFLPGAKGGEVEQRLS